MQLAGGKAIFSPDWNANKNVWQGHVTNVLTLYLVSRFGKFLVLKRIDKIGRKHRLQNTKHRKTSGQNLSNTNCDKKFQKSKFQHITLCKH